MRIFLGGVAIGVNGWEIGVLGNEVEMTWNDASGAECSVAGSINRWFRAADGGRMAIGDRPRFS